MTIYIILYNYIRFCLSKTTIRKIETKPNYPYKKDNKANNSENPYKTPYVINVFHDNYSFIWSIKLKYFAVFLARFLSYADTDGSFAIL